MVVLADGDYLLTGGPARKEAYLQILDKSLSKPPVVLEQVIAEGPAVSRTEMKIAFTERQDKIWTADLVYEDGAPRLAHRKLIVDNANAVVHGIRYEGMVEPPRLSFRARLLGRRARNLMLGPQAADPPSHARTTSSSG